MASFEFKFTIACQPYNPPYATSQCRTKEITFKCTSLGHSTYDMSLVTADGYTYKSRYYENYVHCIDKHAESPGFTNALLLLDLADYNAFNKYFLNILIDNPLNIHIEESKSSPKHAQLSISHNDKSFTLFFD